MNILQRARLAASFLVGGSKTAMQMMSTWQDGQPAYPIGNFENNVRLGYRRNELVYACCMTKADAVSSARLAVYNTRTDKELDTHPAALLMRMPNPHMTEFDFYTLTILSLDLAGRSYWEKRRNRRGAVIELWPLRPDWMFPIKSRSKFIDHFEYRVPGERSENVATEDVLDFKLYDPLDWYATAPPVTVACRAIDTDNATTDFLNKFFRNGGMPTGILTTKQKLNPGDSDEIRASWVERYGGIDNWLRGPAVLDQDAQYQKVGSTFDEMGFPFLDARQEARICLTLRVPPILVGAQVGLEHGTYSNAEQAQEYFWRNMLIPQLKRVRDELQNDLMVREYGEAKVEFRWDTSEVYALQEDRNKAFDRAEKGILRGFLTVNGALEEIGEEGIGEAGEIFLRANSVTAVPVNQLPPAEKTPEEQGAPPAPLLPPVADPPPDGGGNQPPDNMPPMGDMGKTAFYALLEKIVSSDDPDCEDCGEKRKKSRRGRRRAAQSKLGNVDDDCDLIENELETAVLRFFTDSRQRVQDVVNSQADASQDALDLVLWG